MRLRYQACDEKLCYLPTTVQSAWTVQVGAAGKAARGNREVFDRIRFGTGEAPPASAAPAGTAAPAAGSGDPAARLDRFTTLGTTGGYLDRADFLTFIHNAENGVVEKGCSKAAGRSRSCSSSSSAAWR